LDVSKNTALIELFCFINQLTHLDVSKNIALDRLDCCKNKFSASALNALLVTLHDNIIEYNTVYIYQNPGTDSCNTKIAENKGWNVVISDEPE
jgi:hypothetical protein